MERIEPSLCLVDENGFGRSGRVGYQGFDQWHFERN